MSDDTTVHDSSGNVFADLGLEDADEYMAKSELAAESCGLCSVAALRRRRPPSCLASGSPKYRSCSEAASTDFPPTGCSASSTGWATTFRSKLSKPHTKKPGHVEVLAPLNPVIPGTPAPPAACFQAPLRSPAATAHRPPFRRLGACLQRARARLGILAGHGPCSSVAWRWAALRPTTASGKCSQRVGKVPGTLHDFCGRNAEMRPSVSLAALLIGAHPAEPNLAFDAMRTRGSLSCVREQRGGKAVGDWRRKLAPPVRPQRLISSQPFTLGVDPQEGERESRTNPKTSISLIV